jgi:hypothetical protein
MRYSVAMLPYHVGSLDPGLVDLDELRSMCTVVGTLYDRAQSPLAPSHIVEKHLSAVA